MRGTFFARCWSEVESRTMRARLAKLSERIQTSLWLVPAISVVLAALLAFALIDFDQRTGSWGINLPWTFHGGAESARSVLSTIAGSMITVAGTIYSITIVVLTLASVQFAPRVLGSFMRDRSNQVVLGFFVATFTYCLIVLRAVRGLTNDEFVPSTAVTGGVVLALASLGMLIYFIDHIFRGMQVSAIIARVSHETVEQIEKLYGDQVTHREPLPKPEDLPEDNWTPVLAEHSGYVQFIDNRALVRIAADAGAVLRMERSVGSFVTRGVPLATVNCPEAVTTGLQEAINSAVAVGTNPTSQQDVAFGIRQIVDIALKAISPAVNDPTTALNCIDHLGVILVRLSACRMPSGEWPDDDGNLRLVTREREYEDLVRLAFDQIRHYGAGDHVIMIRLLNTIARVASTGPDAARTAILLRYVEHIGASAGVNIKDSVEIETVREHAAAARAALRKGLPSGHEPASTLRR